MNRQIRRVAYALLILFGAIFLNLSWLQLVQAERLAGHPANTRLLLKEYALERGAILSADGRTLAVSRPTPERELKFLRTYPLGALFAPVTGYYSVRFGRAGLELSYNRALTGRGGVLSMQDLGDRLLGRGERGDALVLAIDSRVQQAASDALGSRSGAVAAVDPINGRVLALVSSPSFDPGPLSEHSAKVQGDAFDALRRDADRPLLNRATAESYPPGSIFKVVTAAAALGSGLGVDTSFPSVAEYRPPQTDRTIGNFGGRPCGGNMADAIRASCNTYFARLGAELPKGALEKAARAFGFGERPPIDIRSVASRIPSAELLRSPAFAAQSAIGQFDVSATPLQMALVAAGIANEGKLMVPRIVKEIRDARGLQIEEMRAEVWKEAIPPEIAATLRELMVSAVDSGTGRAAAIAGVRVAGKTGTAQTGRPDGSAHAWFICFAPADNPRIAVAVIVEAGEGGGNETGGRLAAPIARKVLEAHRSAAGW